MPAGGRAWRKGEGSVDSLPALPPVQGSGGWGDVGFLQLGVGGQGAEPHRGFVNRPGHKTMPRKYILFNVTGVLVLTGNVQLEAICVFDP